MRNACVGRLMKYLLPILPFVGAISLLGCGGESGPVAEEAVAPPANVVGGAASTGLAAPANAAAASAIDAAATPVPTDGMAWTAGGDGRSAVFGATGGVRMLTIGCMPGTRQLSITRHAGAPDDGAGTMSLTGSGHASSLPVVASRSSDGSMEWRAVAAGDMGRAFAKAFAIDGPVQLTIGGVPDLIVPATASLRATIARCLG